MGVADNEVAWNGSTFLVAMGCETSTRLFRVSTGGAIAFAHASPSSSIALASAADHFLLVSAQSDGEDVPVDVMAQRLAPVGQLVGGPVALDRFREDRTDLTVAASNGAYLAAWTVTGEDQYPDLASRTVKPNGSLGGTRVLSDDPGPQVDPTLVGGSEGSWFAAWTDPYGSYLDVFGTKVAADGTVAVEDGRPLASLPPSSSTAPGLTRGPSGTAYLTSIRVGFGLRLGVTRKLDRQGAPSGVVLPRGPWAPASQDCRDVAGGGDRFLVTWHETSPLLTRTSSPSATGRMARGKDRRSRRRVRPVISGVRPWPGTVRAGSSSGPTGAPVTPMCSARSCRVAGGVSGRWVRRLDGLVHQISPAVTADGTRWVVAWTDRRNGSGDIYAAGWPPTGCWTLTASRSPGQRGTRDCRRWRAPEARRSSCGWEATTSNGGCCVPTAPSSAGSCGSVLGTPGWRAWSPWPGAGASQRSSRTGWSTPTRSCWRSWTRAAAPPPGGVTVHGTRTDNSLCSSPTCRTTGADSSSRPPRPTTASRACSAGSER